MTEAQSVRVAIDVTAGVVPGTAEEKWTRRFYITSEDWHNPDNHQGRLLADMNGKAMAWAMYLQFQPDAFNWVKTEWVWF